MLRTAIRFIISALVLLLVGYIVPGFAIAGFWNALLAALVIAGVGYLIERMFGEKVSPQGRGLIGFLTAAIVIYLAQYIVPTMQVTIWGALLSALVIGLIDLFVPTEVR